MDAIINGRTHEQIRFNIMECARGHCLSECPYDSSDECTKDLLDDALAMIDHLEAKIPKWISVKERLPEKLNENNQIYITEEVIGFDGEYTYIGRYKIYKFDGHWTFFDGKYFRDDITHWMPLPEPPEER